MASTEDGIKALCALLAAHLEAETAETVFETYVGELLNLYSNGRVFLFFWGGVAMTELKNNQRTSRSSGQSTLASSPD